MDRETALAFCYSKAAGLLRKSFVSSRANLLFEQNSLSDLWTLLFKTQVPLIPEVLLAREIEAEAFRRFVSQYSFFLNQFDVPEEILVDQLKIFDVENLKEISDSLSSGEKDCPDLIELGKYEVLHTEFWPDLKKITEKTEFEWYNTVPDVHSQHNREFLLDNTLVKAMWRAICRSKESERTVLEDLFLSEFGMKNIVWALRLKVYYRMEKDEVVKNLFYVTEKVSLDDPVAKDAVRVLDFDIENYNDWHGWRYEELLNPHINGDSWTVDPSWIERMYRTRLFKKTYGIFHQNAMTTAALVAWFKIKWQELNYIRTATEGLRLKIPLKEAMSAVGIV